MKNQPALHGRDHSSGGSDPIPGPWIYPTSPFDNSWSNAGGGMRVLRYRNSGLGGIDIEGTVTGGTPPSIVTTLDTSLVGAQLPSESQPIPGTGGHDWQLDPDGSLWVIT